ncbi:hypothetical protein [Halorhodospira neutriphila]|uniref:Uncharacterized protein n=1 Tax=Halorhodospira neutriphila TaxID=168379 RepID=A0ABS1E7Y6_9GAMM|nr:hypothetical protein [Halorhodospira neutriphila]MBK1727322.1 hypothetical protein [Halorhodospira neutriphila]
MRHFWIKAKDQRCYLVAANSVAEAYQQADVPFHKAMMLRPATDSETARLQATHEPCIEVTDDGVHA